MYLGWLCGAEEDDAALRASASLELLHAFALLQDDVMDESALRRGRPAAHVAFGRWHRERGLTGPSDRFGESAAILLGDLCLVWAEQDAARERRRRRRAGPGVAPLRRHAHRAGRRAVRRPGQRRACLPDAGRGARRARRKSGNYTVRRPLEIGAAMAGCAPEVLDALGGYGAAIGEAFQLRDDLLGVFGSPTVTGKPVGTDLRRRRPPASSSPPISWPTPRCGDSSPS